MKSSKDFFRATSLLASVLPILAGLTPGADARADSRKPAPPNVLFIIADDLNDALGYMGGHPQARTPNLDRLAGRSATFSKAYVNCPLCNPSRLSLWTGIAPWNSNIFGNEGGPNWRENKVLSNAVTMQEHFKRNGYNVYGTGKVFHVYRQDNLPGTWTNYGNRLGFFPAPGRGEKDNRRWGHPLMPPPLNDDFWLSCGPLSDVPLVPANPAAGIPGYRGWIMGDGTPFRYANEEDRDPMPDEISAKYMVDLLNTAQEKPFFAICGFFRPHEPLYAPKKYFDRFPLHQVALPAIIENDLADVPEILWKAPNAHLREWKRERFLRLLATPQGVEMWRRWMQAYLACIAFVDDQVGRIMAALDASPYADNTIVVFTSDNGYNAGEKETLFKYTLWEKSARVPLIVCMPQRNGRHPGDCGTPVSLIDLYPTLIDLCDLPHNPNRSSNGRKLDGHSLRPLLENPEGRQWLGPAAAMTVIADTDPSAPVHQQHISVRSERWRYTLCANGKEELYDHSHDSREWTNLASDERYASIRSQHNKYLTDFLRSRKSREETAR